MYPISLIANVSTPARQTEPMSALVPSGRSINAFDRSRAVPISQPILVVRIADPLDPTRARP